MCAAAAYTGAFDVSGDTIRKWVTDFEKNEGVFSESKKGKWTRKWILNEEDLKNQAIQFLRKINKDRDRNLRIVDFQKFLNENLLPNSNLSLKAIYGLEIPISWETARSWMHSLGFNYQDHTKDVYYDGHDREDVLEHRKELLQRFFGDTGHLSRTHQFFRCTKQFGAEEFGLTEEELTECSIQGTDLIEFHIDRSKIPLGGMLSLKNPNPGKPLITVVQDEAIFRCFDANKKVWKQKGGGGIRKKGEGQGAMVSGFVTEEFGFVSLSAEQFASFKRAQASRGEPEPIFFRI